MTSYVSADLRRLVEARANRVCKYCLIHEDDTYFGCQVEHIIAEKHGGLRGARARAADHHQRTVARQIPDSSHQRKQDDGRSASIMTVRVGSK